MSAEISGVGWVMANKQLFKEGLDVWASASSCYFDTFYNLQKQVCRTFGSLLVASLEPLAHYGNVASFSLL